jgi:hypothetical protein
MKFFRKMSGRRIIKDRDRKRKIVSVPMTEVFFERLKAQADQRNLAIGTMIREVLMAYFPDDHGVLPSPAPSDFASPVRTTVTERPVEWSNNEDCFPISPRK